MKNEDPKSCVFLKGFSFRSMYSCDCHHVDSKLFFFQKWGDFNTSPLQQKPIDSFKRTTPLLRESLLDSDRSCSSSVGSGRFGQDVHWTGRVIFKSKEPATSSGFWVRSGSKRGALLTKVRSFYSLLNGS